MRGRQGVLFRDELLYEKARDSSRKRRKRETITIYMLINEIGNARGVLLLILVK